MGIFFGDVHCHCGITYGYGSLENALESARKRLDFCSITPHAMWPDIPEIDQFNRYLVTYHKEAFDRIGRNWESVRKTVEEANDDGRFVTLHSYEMHSSFYGDHHFVSPDPSLELIYGKSPAEVAARSRCDLIAIPHHIAYPSGYRGINWDEFRSDISPVVEVYSKHGLGLNDAGYREYYHTMGPRDGRNTAYVGLRRGKKFSFGASTDHHAGFPGSYGDGLIAVEAPSRTRKDLWTALKAGRTYAVTGDRILCDFSMGSLRFGESGAVDGRALIHAAAKASDEIARMVILKNLRPLAIYDSERDGLPHSCEGPYKIRLELGWGDDKEKGFEWDTSVRCIGGKLKGYEPCICGRSVLSPSEDMKQNDNINRILFNASLTDDTFSFAVETYKNISPLHPQTSSAVIEVEGDKDTVLDFSINGRTERHTIKELLETSICGEVLSYASCSYKIHRAVPRSLYEVSMDIEDGGASGDFYHMEVYERNGHAAFVSPIFLL